MFVKVAAKPLFFSLFRQHSSVFRSEAA